MTGLRGTKSLALTGSDKYYSGLNTYFTQLLFLRVCQFPDPFSEDTDIKCEQKGNFGEYCAFKLLHFLFVS